MDVLHLDCETHPVTQDDPAPPPICLQYCGGERQGSDDSAGLGVAACRLTVGSDT